MLKILAVGNSFSQDATALAELLSEELFVRNLFIGGCSLERHCEEIESGSADYSYQQNGEQCVLGGKSLEWALTAENWDVITVQQVSQLSGKKDTYYPWLTRLMDFIGAHTDAKIVFHETWAYEDGCNHPGFANYHNDREEMEKEIASVCAEICKREKLDAVHTGEFIAALRKYDFFNVKKGGISLSRDGFHLNLSHGRLAAAGVWVKFFTGKIPAFFKRRDLSEGFRIIAEALGQ